MKDFQLLVFSTLILLFISLFIIWIDPSSGVMSVWKGWSKLVYISLFNEAVYIRCDIRVKVFSAASGYVFFICIGYYIVKVFYCIVDVTDWEGV